MTGGGTVRGRWVRIALAIAAGLTVLFLLRAIFYATIWYESDPRSHPVEAWMTPRYIVRTYDLPPALVAESLGIGQGESPRKPLADIAEQQGVPVETLILAIEGLVREGPTE
ncbi:MAG: hypothetical protein ACK4GW_09705 [Pseudorhodobacter sp.]